MTMPFTTHQFFDVFTVYISAIWPAQIAAYLLGFTTVATLLHGSANAFEPILSILALM